MIVSLVLVRFIAASMTQDRTAAPNVTDSSSVFLNPNDRRSPWAEAPSAESGPLTLDVRGASVTQLNGGFGEHDVLEVPAPPGIDLRARHDATVWNPRPPTALRGARRCDLVR